MEKLGEHIHWFITTRCNDRCGYCFKPNFPNPSDESMENLSQLANSLIDGGVQKVTIGGGEPTLVKHLEDVLGIFKDAGVYTSLHTNGLLLDKKRISTLSSLVNDIALPIDSIDPETHSMLRKSGDLDKALDTAKMVVGGGIPLGIHTVGTDINISGIPEIYDFLGKNSFDYWRIYEFNDIMVAEPRSNIKRHSELMWLARGGTPEAGHTDCLLAKFFLMEEKIAEHHDDRIAFIAKRDDRPAYVFLDNSGDIRFCDYFSRERAVVGNVLLNSFGSAKKGLEAAFADGVLFDEEGFIESNIELPLWARDYEGWLLVEELGEVDPKHAELFYHLQDLYIQRIERFEKAAVA